MYGQNIVRVSFIVDLACSSKSCLSHSTVLLKISARFCFIAQFMTSSFSSIFPNGQVKLKIRPVGVFKRELTDALFSKLRVA